MSTQQYQQWWQVARASGLVAWALIAASILWGLFSATGIFGRRVSRAWLAEMHRFLSALALVFTVVHVGAIIGDTYVHFDLGDVLVPLLARWHPVSVAWGVAGMYLLAAVEVTSLLRRHMSRRVWHRVHLLSYPLFQVTTIHLLSAGTDARRLLAPGLAIALGTVAVLAGFGGYVRTENLERTPQG